MIWHAGTIGAVSDKRKRESYGPGQKSALRRIGNYVDAVVEGNHPAAFKGVDAYKKASEQHVKVRVYMGICKSCQLVQTTLTHIFAPLIIEHSP